MKAKIFFSWQYIWLGIHWDKPNNTAYIFPVPFVGIKVAFGKPLLKFKERDGVLRACSRNARYHITPEYGEFVTEIWESGYRNKKYHKNKALAITHCNYVESLLIKIGE